MIFLGSPPAAASGGRWWWWGAPGPLVVVGGPGPGPPGPPLRTGPDWGNYGIVTRGLGQLWDCDKGIGAIMGLWQ